MPSGISIYKKLHDDPIDNDKRASMSIDEAPSVSHNCDSRIAQPRSGSFSGVSIFGVRIPGVSLSGISITSPLLFGYSIPMLAVAFLCILLLALPTVQAVPQLAGIGPSEITVCDPSPITYTISVSNPTGASANDPVLTVTIPTGFYYAGSTSITYPDSVNSRITSSQNPTGSGVLTWDLGAILDASRSAVINEIYPNPSTGGIKQVEIFNSGSTTIDLQGWSLQSGSGILATISSSTPLAPGAFLLVQTPGLVTASGSVMLYDSGSVQRDLVTYSGGSSNQGRGYACQPDGARGSSSFAWRSATLGSSNGGIGGDLNVGEIINVSFTLKARCNSTDGQNLAARLDYTGGYAEFTTSSTFLVNRGLLKVLKTPTVVRASVGDYAKFNITVENIGSGTAYNVVMTNTLGSGLSMQSMSPPPDSSAPPNYTWNLGDIPAGGKSVVMVRERVVACVNIYDEARASWGCEVDPCQHNYAKASVLILLRSPRFGFSLPSNLSVPYCGKSWALIPYNNTGLGVARDVHFHVRGLAAQYRIENVTGGSYNPTSSLISIGDVPPGTTGSVAFDLVMNQGACDAPVSGAVAIEPNYFDECNQEWAPPTNFFEFSMNESTRPSLVVTKDGPDSLYLNEIGAYSITALYKRGSCSAENVTVDIVDSYPAEFELLGWADGTVDTTNHTVTWKDVLLEDGVVWSPSGDIVMNASSDPCNCGGVFTNLVRTSTISDCCGCPLSDVAVRDILIECNEGFSSNKTASPTNQESCRLIGYTTEYRFNSSTDLSWAAMNFTEVGNNGQSFSGGSSTGPAVFRVIDANGNVLGTLTQDITLGTPISLAFLEPSWSSDGVVLQISYSLSQNNIGSFVDWSDLNILGRPSGCAGDMSYHEGVSVNAGRSDFSIDMKYPNKMDSCGRYNFTINLHQNGVWPGYQMSISYDDTNFRYLGNATIQGIRSSGSAIASFEPTRSGNTLTWSLGDNITCESGTGKIFFAVEKRCSQVRPIRADLNYRDNCGTPLSDSFTGEPLLLDTAKLILKKTPEVLFATQKELTWRIYVTNSGSGTAYNVKLVDTLDPDLTYIPGSATVDGSAIEPQQSGNILNWSLPDIEPNEGHIIEFDASLVGCENLNNNVVVRWGCGGEYCQEVIDRSRVELVRTTLQAVKHTMTAVDSCGDLADASLWVRNSGDAYSYNITISESLPSGMEMDSYTITSSPPGFAPTATSFSGTSLKWYFNQSSGMAPGTQVNIEFRVRAADSCAFGTGGTARAKAAFEQPCGSTGLSAESPLKVSRRAPNIAISKTPATISLDSGQTVSWTISLTSNGDYAAKQVQLWDILPANAEYISSTPAKDSGTGTAADPLVWNLGSLPPLASPTTITVTARVTGCTPNTVNNASVFWGCCPATRQRSTATASFVTRPSIAINQPLTLSSCGGPYRITITNNGANATVRGLTLIHPVGFVYVSNSAVISSNRAGRTFSSSEPTYDQPTRNLTWSASNLDKIYSGETITINMNLVNCQSCCSAVTTSNGVVTLGYRDSCADTISTATNSKPNTPTKPVLSVTKVPKVQRSGGAVSWTISISNTGNAAASNVNVTDVLGDCYSSIGTAGGTLTSNSPLSGWSTIKWTGQSVPVGSNTWERTVTATAGNLDGNTSNSVAVEGSCASGCVYSRANDSATSYQVALDKGPDVTAIVGDEIVFPINASFRGSTVFAEASLVERLPSGLEYLGDTCISDTCALCAACGGSPTVSSDGSGNTIVTWSLSSFTGPRNISLTVRTRVNNTLTNRRGTTMTNRASVLFKSLGVDQQVEDTAQVRILALPTVGDRVWEDMNRNGVQDSGEPAISNVTVMLRNASVVLTTQTNASGLYQFLDLYPGSYNLSFLLPTGYYFTPQNQGGDDAVDSDADPVTGRTAQFGLVAGQRDFTWDAGLFRLATLGDRVWEDANGNGVQDSGEPAVSDVAVTLRNSTSTLTTTTNATGLYQFRDLIPGVYNVTFAMNSNVARMY